MNLKSKFNVAYIKLCTKTEGPYNRCCIWFQGCNLNCKGCCNKDLQPLFPNHIVSYDENSVTLSRHHIRHYRNHNDFNKIFVRVTEESGTSRELEFAVFFLISFLIFSLLYLLRLLA